MRVIIGLLLGLSLAGCYRVFRQNGGSLQPSSVRFFTKEDCEDFVKKAAVVQPETKRLCARVVE